MMNHRKREIPFDSGQEADDHGQRGGRQELNFVKGAVDVLLKKCNHLTPNPAAGQGRGKGRQETFGCQGRRQIPRRT